MSRPLIPSDPLIFVMLSIILGTLSLLAIMVSRGFWRAWRNHRQLEDELRMRRGFRELKRRGWSPEDLQ